MNCEEARDLLEDLAGAKLTAPKARAVRMHLAACPDCAAGLNLSQWVEVLPALDDTIEPSEDFALRFRQKLGSRPRHWWGDLANWAWPKRLAAAGALTAVILAGILIVRYPGSGKEETRFLGDLSIAESLPLLEDMAVISHIDMLEDFDTIEILPRLMKEQVRN